MLDRIEAMEAWVNAVIIYLKERTDEYFQALREEGRYHEVGGIVEAHHKVAAGREGDWEEVFERVRNRSKERPFVKEYDAKGFQGWLKTNVADLVMCAALAEYTQEADLEARFHAYVAAKKKAESGSGLLDALIGGILNAAARREGAVS